MSIFTDEDKKLFMEAPTELDLGPVYALLWPLKPFILRDKYPTSLEKLWKYHEWQLCYQSMLSKKEYMMSYDKSSEEDQKELTYITEKLIQNDIEFRTFEGKNVIYQEISAPKGLMDPKYIQFAMQITKILWKIYQNKEKSMFISVNKKYSSLLEVLKKSFYGCEVEKEHCRNEVVLRQMEELGDGWTTLFLYLEAFMPLYDAENNMNSFFESLAHIM